MLQTVTGFIVLFVILKLKNTKNMKHLTTAILLLLMFQSGFSQLTLSGEFRPRAEARHGYKNMPALGVATGFFIDQRTRFNLDYKADGFRTYLSLQDVRVWGNQKQLVANEASSVSVHEAWLEAYTCEKVALRLGRQELVYDDHRIFGNVGWTQQARSHDAAVLKYKTDGLKLDMGVAYNQESQANSWISYNLANYKSMAFLWLHKNINEKFGFSFLFLNNGLQPYKLSQNIYELDTAGVPVVVDTKDVHKNIFSQTVGTRLSFKNDKISANSNIYYQTGVSGSVWGYNDNSEGIWTDTKLQAMLIGVDLGYKINEKFGLSAGFEMQSGNSQTDTSRAYSEVQHAFTPFYGTNHKFNGFMDYFYVGNHIGSVGLIDIFGGFTYKLKKNTFAGTFHSFSAAADVLDVDYLAETGEYKAMSPGLGSEIDVSWARPLSEGVKMKVGFSTYFGTHTMEVLRQGSTEEFAGWGYVMIIVKPVFFKSEKK